jgi:hypothetical protein
MTWKEARKRMQSEQQITETEDPKMLQLLARVRRSKFFEWASKDHKNIIDSNEMSKRKCQCFNCILKWPQKNGRYYPLFNYESDIIKAIEVPDYINVRKATEEDEAWYEEQAALLESRRSLNKEESASTTLDKLHRERHSRLIYKHKVGHLCLVKSSGLGVSTLLTSWIAYRCMVNNDWKGKDVIILTGPRQSLSNDILGMIRKLFIQFGITFDTNMSTLILNGVRIRAFPSDHLSAARGIPEVVCIYCDEASWFSPQSQKEVINLIERYAGKSPGCKIILTSTPNKVGDLMHTILSQPFEKSFYKIMKLNYEWGVGKVYTEDDIRTAKASSSFDKEYNLSFNSPSGNSFQHSSIDAAVALAKKYPDTINKDAEHSLGVDAGFGSSSFALVCLEYSDNIIKVVYAKQFERTSYNDMLTEIWNIRNMVGSLNNVYTDMANPEFTKDLKDDFGENSDWNYNHELIARYRKMPGSRVESVMKVVPVSFTVDGASMLVHCKNLLEHEDRLIAINEKYTQLITALKGAVSVDFKLDKSESPLNDLTDAFRLACKYFRLEK